MLARPAHQRERDRRTGGQHQSGKHSALVQQAPHGASPPREVGVRNRNNCLAESLFRKEKVADAGEDAEDLIVLKSARGHFLMGRGLKATKWNPTQRIRNLRA